MMVLSIILGIILIIGGISCMFTPVTTFLATGYLMCAMMLIYGIVGIVRGIRKEAKAIEIVVSVLAIIVGLIALFRPGDTLVFDGVMVYMISAWILLKGIVSIVLAIQARKIDDYWFLGLISGILGVILGVYSFVHPQLVVVTTGILIGFYFIESGINMIVLSAFIDRISD